MSNKRGHLGRRHTAYVPFVDSLESRVVLTSPESAGINTLVLEFAQDHLTDKVGGGECGDLAQEALRVAGANFAGPDAANDGDYVWGNLITTITPGHDSNSTVACKPGDIIQYPAVTLSNGSTIEQHTQIVAAVDANGRPISVYEQNAGGIRKDEYDSAVVNAATVTRTAKIYQPVARVDSPGTVQFTVTNDAYSAQTVTVYANNKAVVSLNLTTYNTADSDQYEEVSSTPSPTWTIGVGGQQIALNNAAGYEVGPDEQRPRYPGS